MTSLRQAMAASGLDRLDAQLLLLHALSVPPQDAAARRAWLLAHPEADMPVTAVQAFNEFVQRRVNGEPLAYITGHKEFFGLDLAVDARVLVPRPDTELLVQWALDTIDSFDVATLPPPHRVLDLGTGSGAVALAIRHTRPEVLVDALDASAGALKVAQANALSLGLTVRFLQGSWLAQVTTRYHCIVANPPYIADHDPHLAALRHEPRAALAAGPDGLNDLRSIVDTAGPRLCAGGCLLVEHGYDQAAAVRALFNKGGYANVVSRRDLAGHERCTGGRVIGDSRRPMMK